MLNITITPSHKARRNQPVSEEERKLLRGALGELKRPEISFYVCQLSTIINTATISDLIAVNKVIKFAINNPGYLKFSRLNIEGLSIKVFSDASWNNLPDGGSHGGKIVLLGDNRGYVSTIYWSSTHFRRFARSSMAAEALSVMDGCDSAQFISKLLQEILHLKNEIPIIAVNESNDLFSTSSTTKLVTDRRLRL